jgi:hypothetical protein
MRSDELLARVRQSAFIGDAVAFPDYTNQVIFDELNDRQRSVFSDQVVSARNGYWLHRDVVTVTNGCARFPRRSVVGGLESVDQLVNGQYWHLRELTPREANDWGTTTVPANGKAIGYWCDSEKINIVPTPSGSVTLRMRYYLRPSLIVTQQSSDLTDRGRITAVDLPNRTATVNDLPLSYPSGATLDSADIVDVVRPNGWHVCTAIEQLCSITGGVNVQLVNMSVADFTEAVQVGDYIRARDQTDWPALPSDYHRTLADAAAVNILRELSLDEKASTLGAAASADFARFAKLINPRVKSEPKRIRQRPYWMRSRW